MIQWPPQIVSLGSAIRHLREIRGMTLRQLARDCDLSTPFLCDLEKDRRGTERLDVIAVALGVGVSDLARFDIHRKQFTRRELNAERERVFRATVEACAVVAHNTCYAAENLAWKNAQKFIEVGIRALKLEDIET